MRALDTRIERLRELYELGDVTRAEYRARRETIAAQRAELERAQADKTPAASETIASLVDDWSDMDAGQKRQVLETIFTDVTIDEGQLVRATPRPGWLRHIEAVLGERASVSVVRRRRESNPR